MLAKQATLVQHVSPDLCDREGDYEYEGVGLNFDGVQEYGSTKQEIWRKPPKPSLIS